MSFYHLACILDVLILEHTCPVHNCFVLCLIFKVVNCFGVNSVFCRGSKKRCCDILNVNTILFVLSVLFSSC